MRQSFLDFARAGDFSYCRPYCAKCYFRFLRDFIEPMERARGTWPNGGYPSGMWWPQIMGLPGVKDHLTEELENLPLAEFLKLKHWDGHLAVAFTMLNDQDLQARILRHWFDTCPDDVRFVDVVIFDLLSRAVGLGELRDDWISKAVNMALARRDYSLVETLVWRLSGSLEKYPALLALATELQQTSPRITKSMSARS